jgi:hypothetical protein
MKKLCIAVAVLASTLALMAQPVPNPVPPRLSVIPVSGCAFGPIVWKSSSTTGAYHCVGGNYVAVSSGTGSGTVTSVGNGTISALFSASWATATSTPALSLSFANQSGRKFFASPSDGSSGAIIARAIIAADVPALDPTAITGTAVITTDSRLSNARTPTAHATSHQNGGADEVATATPGANAIPKAGSGGTLASGWVPTLNQNTTGTAAAFAANGTNCTGAQKASGVDASGNAEGCTAIAYTDVTGTPTLATVATSGSATDLSAGTLAAARMPALTGDVTTSAGAVATTLATVTVAKGGTGLTTLTANNVILGNGTSTPSFVAPSTSGNVLTSNGTTWTSAAAASSGANTALSNLASVAINAPIATGAGTTLALSSTAPTQTASAQAGTPITITSSAAIAGSSNAGAASGGAITIAAGNAARLTSGNADGPNITLTPGAGVGAGIDGYVKIADSRMLRFDSGASVSGFGFFFSSGSDAGRLQFWASGNEKFALDTEGIHIGSTSSLHAGPDYIKNNRDINLMRDSAGVWKIVGGGLGGDAKGGLKTVADSNGSYALASSNTELLTLSLGGTATATAANLCPVGSRIKAILYRVTTTITGTASFQIAPTGLSSYVNIGTATALQSTLTAGTTGIMVASTYGDGFENAANTVTVTTTATAATAGAIRITVVYEQYSAPSS